MFQLQAVLTQHNLTTLQLLTPLLQKRKKVASDSSVFNLSSRFNVDLMTHAPVSSMHSQPPSQHHHLLRAPAHTRVAAYWESAERILT